MANVVEITDFSAKELDIYARCTEVQLLNREDPSKGIFIAESRRSLRVRWMPDACRYPFLRRWGSFRARVQIFYGAVRRRRYMQRIMR